MKTLRIALPEISEKRALLQCNNAVECLYRSCPFINQAFCFCIPELKMPGVVYIYIYVNVLYIYMQ